MFFIGFLCAEAVAQHSTARLDGEKVKTPSPVALDHTLVQEALRELDTLPDQVTVSLNEEFYPALFRFFRNKVMQAGPEGALSAANLSCSDGRTVHLIRTTGGWLVLDGRNKGAVGLYVLVAGGDDDAFPTMGLALSGRISERGVEVLFADAEALNRFIGEPPPEDKASFEKARIRKEVRQVAPVDGTPSVGDGGGGSESILDEAARELEMIPSDTEVDLTELESPALFRFFRTLLAEGPSALERVRGRPEKPRTNAQCCGEAAFSRIVPAANGMIGILDRGANGVYLMAVPVEDGESATGIMQDIALRMVITEGGLDVVSFDGGRVRRFVGSEEGQTGSTAMSYAPDPESGGSTPFPLDVEIDCNWTNVRVCCVWATEVRFCLCCAGLSPVQLACACWPQKD
ncbi:MAG: hypothetical protein D6788_07820 [Planctomycetota bacterium]|nr:MAG: hypothetical protein D6788_07820 [Planctomycetota bacterium]